MRYLLFLWMALISALLPCSAAIVRLVGVHTYTPSLGGITINPAFDSLLLDSGTDQVHFVGRFVHKDHSAKTVDGVGFLFGTITKTNGSTFQVALQDVDITNGPPQRGDGTDDQVLTIANADAGFASNAWYTGGFDGAATRSLTHGDRIAIVLDFASFQAGDSVNIRGLTRQASTWSAESGTTANLTGSLAAQVMVPNVVLRCSDGTYGTIENAWPISALNTHAIHVNTGTADEYAMAIQFPFGVTVDGLYVPMTSLSTGTETTEVVLYSGTTALVTATVDHNAIRSTTGGIFILPIAEQALAANTLYRIAVRPTGTTGVTVTSFDVATAAHFQAHAGDASTWHLWTRVDQGSWGGEVTTRRLFAGVRVSGVDTGGGQHAVGFVQ